MPTREEAGEGRGRGGLGEPGTHPCVLPTQVMWILSSGGSTLIPVLNKRVKGLPCQDADEPQACWRLHQVFCRRGLKEGKDSPLNTVITKTLWGSTQERACKTFKETSGTKRLLYCQVTDTGEEKHPMPAFRKHNDTGLHVKRWGQL